MPRTKKTEEQQPKTRSKAKTAEVKAPVAEHVSQQNAQPTKPVVEKAPSFVTSEGNVVKNVQVYQDKKVTRVSADYLIKDRKDPEKEPEKVSLSPRPLTPEQQKEYTRLNVVKGPAAALEFALKAAFPYHIDDKAYHTVNEVNGQAVDYVKVEKNTKENVKPGEDQWIGKMAIEWGQYGNKEKGVEAWSTRRILSDEEILKIKKMYRSDVKLAVDKNGKTYIKELGAPISLGDLANRIAKRIEAKQQLDKQREEAAKRIPFDSYSLPEGTKVENRIVPDKTKPNVYWVNGTVNGIKIHGKLSENEATAALKKLAPIEKVAASNKMFHDAAWAAAAGSIKLTKEDAVAIVVARASAKGFTSEQYRLLNEYAGQGEDRGGKIAEIWNEAEVKLKDGNVEPKWIEEAKNDLDDLEKGVRHEPSRGMGR